MANKLELTWYGKDKEISVEPRLLIEKPELSNTDAAPDTENMLIHGDNLLALKALESKYAGQVKCIYIVICSWMVFFIPFHKKFYTYLHLNIKIKMHALRS